jgi:Zn2+/Cd2+-exporting ATPase
VATPCCNIPPTAATGDPDGASDGFCRRWLRLPGELGASVTAGVLLTIGFALTFAPGAAAAFGEVLVWISLAIGLVYGGRAAWEALSSRRFDIDVLMVLAAGLAALMGRPEDGALLMFLFTLAGALEDRAMSRTMRAVEALSKLMPTRATVWRDDAWAEVDPREVAVGERLWLRTGELVPCDARVVQGATSIDQATLTGESVPRNVQPGDDIYAGTINVGNPIEAMVARPASESSLQKILNLVISAQQQREPMQRLIDRLSQPYAVGVVLVSSAVFLLWWLAFGDEVASAAYTAIALLIIASPCALVIATPTATLAAISRAARAGVLFKGGQSIDRLARMGSVCLDKTGTLTLGRPRLRQVHAVGWSRGGELLSAAAALESGSTHPIAVAVVDAAASRGVQPAASWDLQDLPGRGIAGEIGDTSGSGDGQALRRPARLGTYEHCEPLIPVCLRGRIREVLEKVRERGQIAVVIAVGGAGSSLEPAGGSEEGAGGGEAGVLILSDTVRPGARDLVARLKELGIRPVRMLTGDNRTTAAQLAADLGIDEWQAELLPEDKVRLMQELRRERRGQGRGLLAMLATLTPGGARRVASGVGVVGDGVNDAPALAAADVSVAIGSIGSDAALETADIVLLNEDLFMISWAVRLARRTRAIVLFNMILALSVIVLMGGLTLVVSRLGGQMPLFAAVLAHEGGTLLVVLNSLRLLMVRAPHHGELADQGRGSSSEMLEREADAVGLAA